MPSAGAGETTYERDYRIVGGLKMLADAHPGSSIIVVHHTRKASGSDFVDAVSGTQGIAGAADTILLLQRDREKEPQPSTRPAGTRAKASTPFASTAPGGGPLPVAVSKRLPALNRRRKLPAE